MKHPLAKNATVALLITILIGTTLGCSEVPSDELILQRIAITTPPTKTVYELGESLDISGLVITGTYSDRTINTETVSLSDISGYDANHVGQQTLTVTVDGRTAIFTVRVNAALQRITVSTPPTKTVYDQDESLDISGLMVTRTYVDGTSQTTIVSESDISGYDATSVGQQTLTVTVGGKTATFTVTVHAALQSIAITGSPTKIVYARGESLDISGLVVTGTYSDETSQTITVSESDISGYDATSVGQQTLTVTVSGKTATFMITVNEAALQSIAITSQPTKIAYAWGERLDISGLVVTGAYSDGTTQTETVGISDISGYDANRVGQQTLTVTVGGKTATFTVTVNAIENNAVLQSIAISNQPTKTVYTYGERFDITGLVVTGTYSDRTNQTITVSESNISGYDTNRVGQQTLTVTVGGKTATFMITVNAPASEVVLQSIAISNPPTKTVYAWGESLDISGLVVTGTYSDRTTQTETVGISDISGYDAISVGSQTLTVTVGGKIATFMVTVNAADNDAILQSIAISTLPTKTVYARGESLDITGLVVTGTYSDGTSQPETVSESDISGYDRYSEGQQTLTVTVGSKTATFMVTVNATASEVVLQSIAVTSLPTKTVYTRNERLDISGLVVTGTYSDRTTQTETVNESNISGYDANRLGQQTLTVTVGGKTATFTVNVRITASFTVNFEDPVNGLPEDIVLSKNGTLTYVSLEIVGDYESYQWLLNDSETPVSTSASYILNAADCLLGVNSLMVEVRTAGGAYYAKEITFRVNRR
jgi:hypothetical protein